MQRVFDKWPVYLAFTVNEAARDDVLFPFSLALHPSLYEVRLFGPDAQCVQEAQLAVHSRRVGQPRWVLMAFTAESPPSSLCHQVSSNIKKTHLPRFPPEGNQRLLASHKAPGYHFAPLT